MRWSDASIGKLKTRGMPRVFCVGSGLYLLARETGERAWIFRYLLEGDQRKTTLGHWPKMRLAAARREAQMLRAALRDGADPAAWRLERKASTKGARVTVRDFSERWLREIVRKARKDHAPVKRVLDREILPVIGKRAIASVTQAEIQKMIFGKRDRGRPAAAKILRDVLKRLFEYAKACSLVTVNPVEATPQKFVAKLKSRTRSLSESELKLFFQRLDGSQLPRWAAISLELLLLTMTRKSELRLARWAHIDLMKGTWEIPPELSKTGVPHIVYLSKRASDLLWRLAGHRIVEGWGDHYVLPAQSSMTQPMNANALNKAVARVKWGMPAFTVHDLRRTAATILGEQGYDKDWIEAALNHTKKGIRGVYNRAQYAPQRKKMLEEWSQWLSNLHG